MICFSSEASVETKPAEQPEKIGEDKTAEVKEEAAVNDTTPVVTDEVKEATPEEKETVTEVKETTAEVKESVTEVKESTTEAKETPAESQEGTVEMAEPPAETGTDEPKEVVVQEEEKVSVCIVFACSLARTYPLFHCLMTVQVGE